MPRPIRAIPIWQGPCRTSGETSACVKASRQRLLPQGQAKLGEWQQRLLLDRRRSLPRNSQGPPGPSSTGRSKQARASRAQRLAAERAAREITRLRPRAGLGLANPGTLKPPRATRRSPWRSQGRASAMAPLNQAQGERRRPPCRATQWRAFQSAQEAALQGSMAVLKAAWFARYRITVLFAAVECLGAINLAYAAEEAPSSAYCFPRGVLRQAAVSASVPAGRHRPHAVSANIHPDEGGTSHRLGESVSNSAPTGRVDVKLEPKCIRHNHPRSARREKCFLAGSTPFPSPITGIHTLVALCTYMQCCEVPESRNASISSLNLIIQQETMPPSKLSRR
jgi:hypothetical protein